MGLAFLLLLSGCILSTTDTLGQVSSSEEAISDLEIINPDVYTIEHNTTLYNYIGSIIDEVRLVKGNTSEILASNIQSGSSVLAQWVTTEQSPPSQITSIMLIYYIEILKITQLNREKGK